MKNQRSSFNHKENVKEINSLVSLYSLSCSVLFILWRPLDQSEVFIFRGFIGANGVVASFEEDSKFY